MFRKEVLEQFKKAGWSSGRNFNILSIKLKDLKTFRSF